VTITDDPVALIIVAAGKGLRAGGGLPKQYRHIGQRMVLAHTLAALAAARHYHHVILVIAAGDHECCARAVAESGVSAPVEVITGGATRQASVRQGLERLAANAFAGVVLIHDAARPFVSTALVEAAVAAARAHGAAVPGLLVADTIKSVDIGSRVTATVERAALRAIQTPQAFDFATILTAHRAAPDELATDDAGVIEAAGGHVHVFAGEATNIKLTTQADFEMAEARLAARLITRVATGYDVHRFQPGDHVWLGGVRIAHDQGVEAHSDGDVALHALTDAILGLIGDGDIGQHFPPSDPQWRGASSDRFLEFAADRLRERGGILDHLDLSIVCEAPRIGPHREVIRARIAEIAGVAVERVALKVTTSERLGFIGRREGLAALATVTARLPDRDE
jgi:2-C-methyl-D-erythritol 4-phosphate cytidylyltransferase / 2-C-methyl-D-erythritol 2,4-cyclodiphosphate synthase